jgi:hypothetical protein
VTFLLFILISPVFFCLLLRGYNFYWGPFFNVMVGSCFTTNCLKCDLAVFYSFASCGLKNVLCLFTRVCDKHILLPMDNSAHKLQAFIHSLYLLTTESRQALGSVHPSSTPVGTSDSFPGCKVAGAQSLPHISKVKNAWSYTSTHPVHLHGVVLS